MSARKPRFTADERAVLDPLAVRCIVAAVRQSEAEAAYRARAGLFGVAAQRREALAFDKKAEAEAETGRAGKAFGGALRRIGGGK